MSPEEFKKKGYYLTENFLSGRDCARLLQLVAVYRKNHAVPEIYRQTGGERPLRYSVIDGECIKRHLPEVMELYREINATVNRLSDQPLVPLANEKVACNINIMTRGGTYRWHYDRNAVTAILYLNEISSGGETECYPNYRLFLRRARFSRLQQWLDRMLQNRLSRRFFGKQLICPARAGCLLVMRGDRCLHSVRPLKGDEERINIIMSFDAPGADFAVTQRLDAYLYNQNSEEATDPNYRI
jgi:hypothetical protein